MPGATDINAALDDLAKKLRDAADQVGQLKGRPPEEISRAVADLQSCCGDCTLVSPMPPCPGACIMLPSLL